MENSKRIILIKKHLKLSFWLVVEKWEKLNEASAGLQLESFD
jgi:hypothetical protein